MLRTLLLTGLLCDKHPLKEEVEQNKQLFLKNVPRSDAVIDVHGYPIETKSEHPQVIFYSLGGFLMLFKRRMKHREIERLESARKYPIGGKRGKTKAATTGKYQARETRASKVTFLLLLLPDWLKLHCFGQRKSRKLPRS